MRHITNLSCNAFKNQKNFRLSNSEVVTKEDEKSIVTRYFLHWNEIATLYNRKTWWKQLFISNCGYETNVTKERLNWILSEFWLWWIYQKNFTRYLETTYNNYLDEVVKFPSWKNEGYSFIF